MQYSPMLAVYGLNLLGIDGKHKFWDRTGILAFSYATMGIIVNSMKYAFKEKRPDNNARNSFPSDIQQQPSWELNFYTKSTKIFRRG